MAKKYPNAKIRLEDNTGKILEENTFKVGQKVTYLGHPAVVTATKEYNGRNYVSVSYDKGTGKTKASDILATSGDVKILNENVFVEAFKLEKALKDMGYNVKVKYLDDFGTDVFEIYFNNPADADESIFYDAQKLGYDNVRVFANPNESVNEAYIVTYAKSKGEKPASAAYKLRGSALAFMRDLEKDGYITMLTQKPVDGVDESVGEEFARNTPNMRTLRGFLKAISKEYGPTPTEQSLADFIYNNYEAVTGEKLENSNPEANDHIADIVAHFKMDGEDFMMAWEDRTNEPIDEYNSGIYFDPDKKVKQASKSAMDKVRDAIKKAMIGDYKPSVTEAKPKKATGEKITKDVFAKLKGKTINYKGHDYKVIDSDEAVLKIKHLEDGDVTTINLRQFNVSGMIEEILETIELGKQLEEGKLCPKGEAYRKRRMAAGEKSSAYLSGRAVKVCKGQMSGKKK